MKRTEPRTEPNAYLLIMSSSPPAVEVSGVSRSFGRRRAVDAVDLTVHSGECVALFGPNGAGKTTLLRLVAGLIKPTKGSVRVGGHSLRDDPAMRARVGLISHQSMLYGALTARENVEFSARLYGVPQPRHAAMRALERMQIAERANTPVKSLSRGLQQRVSIARAVVHDPSVVLLDEPYTGLDTIGGGALTDMLMLLRGEGASLVLVTHNVDEGLAVASHALVMIAGRIVRRDLVSDVDARTYLADYRALAGNAERSKRRGTDPVTASA